ncbi:MAG: hypothetical protein JWO37_302 [Acidimicrobiales bacterium]|nr:hypothetical protein [Acidimicrobiales bacterium]
MGQHRFGAADESVDRLVPRLWPAIRFAIPAQFNPVGNDAVGMSMRRAPVLALALATLAACSHGGGGRKPAAIAGATTSTSTSAPQPATTTVVSSTTTTGAGAATTTRAAAAKAATAPRPPTTAPAATTAGGATIAGCPLFPADNPWRRDVSGDPLDSHSAAWVSSIGAGGRVHPDWGSVYGIPYVVVPANQQKVPITFTAYGDESDPGPYPVPPNAPIESGSDSHVLVASGDCHLYELYHASPDGHGGWNADSGAIFDLRSDRLRPDTWTSADAAGLPILPGLVRWDEVQAGHIDHALRFTIARTQRGYIHPATHQAGSTTDPNVAPMGARFRLKASFDISHYTGTARVVLLALKRYGMFVADNGSNWYITGALDSRWNDDEVGQLKSVPGSAFEAVASGPVLH